jgi:hypothetical protein
VVRFLGEVGSERLERKWIWLRGAPSFLRKILGRGWTWEISSPAPFLKSDLHHLKLFYPTRGELSKKETLYPQITQIAQKLRFYLYIILLPLLLGRAFSKKLSGGSGEKKRPEEPADRARKSPCPKVLRVGGLSL